MVGLAAAATGAGADSVSSASPSFCSSALGFNAFGAGLFVLEFCCLLFNADNKSSLLLNGLNKDGLFFFGSSVVVKSSAGLAASLSSNSAGSPSC